MFQARRRVSGAIIKNLGLTGKETVLQYLKLNHQKHTNAIAVPKGMTVLTGTAINLAGVGNERA